jgi:predicted Zn-dependent protease
MAPTVHRMKSPLAKMSVMVKLHLSPQTGAIMASKSAWKGRVQKAKKRIKRLHKLIKIGVKTIAERDVKIKQLTSVMEQEQQQEKRR